MSENLRKKAFLARECCICGVAMPNHLVLLCSDECHKVWVTMGRIERLSR